MIFYEKETNLSYWSDLVPRPGPALVGVKLRVFRVEGARLFRSFPS